MSSITGPIPFGESGTPSKAFTGQQPHSPGDNYLTHGKGIRSWIFTLDHKRIGLMYMMAILSAFAIGGLFAILLRSMLWHPVDFGVNPARATASSRASASSAVKASRTVAENARISGSRP